jgi:Raf kinase inhibitor-like YbhB/YbcL family protein
MRPSIWVEFAAIVLVASALCVGCSGSDQEGAPSSEAGAVEEEAAMAIELKSNAFEDGDIIPKKYTCDAEDVSPPLKWGGLPESTMSIALICDDPDAPRGTWVHWVLYDLPPDDAELPEALPMTGVLRNGARQGTNDFRRIGYGGPCPPPGKPHRYFFKLYAIDRMLGLEPGAKKADLLEAMDNHVLAEGRLMGTYGR